MSDRRFPTQAGGLFLKPRGPPCPRREVPLGAILSLQIGSSASPVSGTVFVTTLALCSVALIAGRNSIEHVPGITMLLVTACVAVCAANDVSQDYKTLQLCGVAPRDGFVAQLVGLLAGSVLESRGDRPLIQERYDVLGRRQADHGSTRNATVAFPHVLGLSLIELVDVRETSESQERRSKCPSITYVCLRV